MAGFAIQMGGSPTWMAAYPILLRTSPFPMALAPERLPPPRDAVAAFQAFELPSLAAQGSFL
jgi:hypothetical protein